MCPQRISVCQIATTTFAEIISSRFVSLVVMTKEISTHEAELGMYCGRATEGEKVILTGSAASAALSQQQRMCKVDVQTVKRDFYPITTSMEVKDEFHGKCFNELLRELVYAGKFGLEACKMDIGSTIFMVHPCVKFEAASNLLRMLQEIKVPSGALVQQQSVLQYLPAVAPTSFSDGIVVSLGKDKSFAFAVQDGHINSATMTPIIDIGGSTIENFAVRVIDAKHHDLRRPKLPDAVKDVCAKFFVAADFEAALQQYGDYYQTRGSVGLEPLERWVHIDGKEIDIGNASYFGPELLFKTDLLSIIKRTEVEQWNITSMMWACASWAGDSNLLNNVIFYNDMGPALEGLEGLEERGKVEILKFADSLQIKLSPIVQVISANTQDRDNHTALMKCAQMYMQNAVRNDGLNILQKPLQDDTKEIDANDFSLDGHTYYPAGSRLDPT